MDECKPLGAGRAAGACCGSSPRSWRRCGWRCSAALSTRSCGRPANRPASREVSHRPLTAAAGGAHAGGQGLKLVHISSTSAILVTPPPVPRVPLSNRLGGNHAPNVFHKMCSCSAEKWTSVSPCGGGGSGPGSPSKVSSKKTSAAAAAAGGRALPKVGPARHCHEEPMTPSPPPTFK